MTLDEAIRHCLKQARKLQDKADRVGDDESRQCMECAADHIQLAEWLRELKETKRLLKAAVEDINYYVDCYEAHCDECCCDHDNHCHWKHEAEALALIGGEEQ